MSTMKLGYRPDEAAGVVGSTKLFDDMVANGWLKPVIQGKRLTLYDAGDIVKCWGRILKGEKPIDGRKLPKKSA